MGRHHGASIEGELPCVVRIVHSQACMANATSIAASVTIAAQHDTAEKRQTASDVVGSCIAVNRVFLALERLLFLKAACCQFPLLRI
jgi:hypothetical protein